MTNAQIIERAADEAELEPEQLERALEALGEAIRRAAARDPDDAHEPTVLALALGVLLGEAPDELEAMAKLVAASASAWAAQGRQLDELAVALTPAHVELPAPAALLQARRNVEVRGALLAEFGGLRSAEVAELAGSRATNRAALANRWRSEGRVLAVPVGDELVYPGFQFGAEGRPHPAVATALAELRRDRALSDWQAALWFAAPSGWLGGRRPVDMLDSEPDAVAEAARREAAERVF